MGNSASIDRGAAISYAKPLSGSGDAEHTVTYRPSTHVDALVKDFGEGGKSKEKDVILPWGGFLRGVAVGEKKPCLGYRARLPAGGLSTEYTWMTFKEVKQLALDLGSGLVGLGVDKAIEFPDEPLAPSNRFLGIMSKNRLEWHVTDFACCAYNICSIPLYDTLGEQAMQFILDQTRLIAIVAPPEEAVTILKVLKSVHEEDPEKVHLKQLVIMGTDPLSGKDKALASTLGVNIHTWQEIVKKGQTERFQPVQGNPNDIFTICYTSGTTGNPKGVIIPNHVWVGGMSGTMLGPFRGRPPFEVNSTDVYLSYLPLAHVYERIVTHCVISQGAQIGYYSGDVTKIVEDCRLLKPTVFCSVPRLYNRINDKVIQGLKEKNVVKRTLFNKGLNSKTTSYRKSSFVSSGIWDPVVFNKTKALLGGRIKVMVTGSAPIDPTVQEKMNLLFSAPLCQGFGMTETCGIGFVCHPADNKPGHVGGPFACQEFRLESVPDMQYYVTDNPPRGELCVRGPNVFVGYFRDPEQSKEALDKNGWLHTGDIAEVAANGSVRIIDRKKNIFKLMQGEYVAPERIEGVYNQCPLIAQSFVFGYSTKATLVAVIIPDELTVKKWRPKASFPELCDTQSKDLIEAIMAEMDCTAKSCGLKGFEKAKKIHIAKEPFSVDNNILTPTFKIRRKDAEKAYKKQIDEIYKGLD